MDDPFVNKEERTWAMFAHLSALGGHIVPFGHIILPLVIWLIKKDQMPLVDKEGKESINFQISITIYGVIAGLLCIILIGFFLLAALWIFDIVAVIIASIKTYEGNSFRYPLTIRFLK